MAKRVAILAALAIGSMVGAGSAAASPVNPPTVTAAFAPNPVTFADSQQSTYTITLTNPNPSATLTGISIGDTLPADLQFLGGTSVSQTCSGSEASTTTTLSESGLTLAPGDSCTLSAVVVAGDAGSYPNTTGQVTSNEGGTGLTASATLNMMVPPQIAASFTPAVTNTASETSILSVAVTNPNTGAPLQNVAFSGALPSGLSFAAPSQGSGCGDFFAILAQSGTFALQNGTIAAGATCTVSIEVQATGAGTFTYSAGLVSSDSGNGNTADPTTLTVVSPPVVAASFSPATVAEGVTSTLTVTVTNNNATTLTGVAVSDTLPSGLVALPGTGGWTNGCPNTLSFGNGPGLAFSMGVGSISANTVCTITVGVSGSSAGSYTDMTSPASSNEGGNGVAASASLLVAAPPSVSASFSPATVAEGVTSQLTVTITNNNASTTLTGVSLSETLPSGLVSLAGTDGWTCSSTPGFSFGPGQIFSTTGNTLAPLSSCTIHIGVSGSSAASYNVMTSTVASNEGGTGVAASAGLLVLAPPSIGAGFSPGTVTVGTGGSSGSTLTFTIGNPNASTALTGVAFTQTLPSGLAVAATPAISNTCGGTPTATAGSSAISLSGGSAAGGGNCTLAVAVQASSVQTFNLTSGAVSSTNGGTGNTASASLIAKRATPIVGSVSPNAGPLVGGTTVTITGENFTVAAGVAFGSTAATSFTVISDTSISAIAPVHSAGTVDVTVTNGTGTSATVVADAYTYLAAPSIGAGFSPSTVTVGSGGSSGSTLTFTITNASSAAALTGLAFSQTLPSGLAVAATPAISNTCSGTPTATAGSNSISLTGGSVASGSNCAVSVAVQASSVQTFNLISAAVSSTNGGTGNTASASLIANRATPIVGGVSPNAGPLGGGTAVTITGDNFTAAAGVSFGGTAATSFTVISDTSISAIAPARSAGTVDITVTNGTGTSATVVADAYTYTSGPVVTALSPAGGPLGGGNSVTITGSNLTGATAVKFGTVAATSFIVDNASQVTAIAPAGVAGSVDVTVTTPGGTSAAVPTDLYTYGTSVVTLSASVNPSHFGDPVTLTAAVGSTSGVPTGTVGFWDGSTLLATGTLANHLTSVTISTLTVGSHSITARYAGDGEFSAGASSPLTLVVDSTSVPTTEQGVYAYRSTLGTAGVAQADNSHLAAPSAVALDRAHGHVLVADSGNHRVQIYDAASLAVIGTIGVPGIAGSDNAHLDQPGGVGFDPASDRIFVADTLNQRVQIFDGASFAYLSTLPLTLDLPASVVVNTASNQLYIADSGDHRVLVLDAGSFASVATLGVAGVAGADNAHLNTPMDAEFDPSTNQILVADSANRRVQVFDASSFAYVSTLGDANADPADNLAFSRPVGAAFDPISNLVLVADAGAESRVQVFDAMTYRYVLTLGTTGSAGASSSQFAAPGGLAVDPDHARLYVADQANDRVQSFSIAPVSSFAATLPGSRSVRLGTPATIFASFDNNSTATLGDCRVALPVTAPPGLTLDYQTTNPSTNALTGTPDMPATIPGKSLQTFLVTLQAADPLTAAGQALDFDCEGAAPATVILGVDTVDLTIAAGPVPDIIALAATPSDDGILVVPSGGAAAFAVATSNAGAGAQIIASVDTGTATLPLGVTLCQSNPSSGQCLSTPAATVTFTDAAGASPTFSIFAQASGTIPLDPATSRLFVRFKDASGALRGSTSVAVQTR